MLKELSLRNAKRQMGEYALYFITLSCIVSFLYAFNTLIFSDSVSALPDMDVLPYMIVAASLLIVLITGRVISYMASYMLRRRGREFGIYMMSGIPNRQIASLISRETLLLGSLAFLPGLFLGMLLSQLLEAAVLPMFGVRYALRFPLSLPAMGLTALSFFLILLSSLLKNRKWIRKVKLYDLILLERQNEAPFLSGRAYGRFPDGKWISVTVFSLSLCAGGTGFWFIQAMPVGSGYDLLFGTILLALFLFGFFQSIPAFLVTILAERPLWKYKKRRLLLFRNFTAKIRSTSTALGMLSVLFMLSLTFYGIGAALSKITDETVASEAFDLLLVHREGMGDFSAGKRVISSALSLEAAHSYTIYTDSGTDFSRYRDEVMLEMGYSGNGYTEFFHDTYMKQSDYLKLREMLGYRAVQLDPDACYVHCLPSLEAAYRRFLESPTPKTYAGYPVSGEELFTEPFCQAQVYGNGLGYILIVPDEAARRCTPLYSLYVALTGDSLDYADFESIARACGGLSMLMRNTVVSSGKTGYSSFTKDTDYLSGKCLDKSVMSQFSALSICLSYLGLVLEITGAAILATQLLSDRGKQHRQDAILRQLGMAPRKVAAANRLQTGLFFLLPLPPALLVSSCYILLCAKKMAATAFLFPLFWGGHWILSILGTSLLFFGLLYGVYYAAARISSRENYSK